MPLPPSSASLEKSTSAVEGLKGDIAREAQKALENLSPIPDLADALVRAHKNEKGWEMAICMNERRIVLVIKGENLTQPFDRMSIANTIISYVLSRDGNFIDRTPPQNQYFQRVLSWINLASSSPEFSPTDLSATAQKMIREELTYSMPFEMP